MPQAAQDAAQAFREHLRATFNEHVAQAVRVLYGGEVEFDAFAAFFEAFTHAQDRLHTGGEHSTHLIDDVGVVFGMVLHVAQAVRVLYGGSVSSKNAVELITEPDVDGFLIGGAALDVDELNLANRPRAMTIATHTRAMITVQRFRFFSATPEDPAFWVRPPPNM